MLQPSAANRFSLLPSLFLGAQALLAPMCYSQATTNLNNVQWHHGAEDCDSAKADTGYVGSAEDFGKNLPQKFHHLACELKGPDKYRNK